MHTTTNTKINTERLHNIMIHRHVTYLAGTAGMGGCVADCASWDTFWNRAQRVHHYHHHLIRCTRFTIVFFLTRWNLLWMQCYISIGSFQCRVTYERSRKTMNSLTILRWAASRREAGAIASFPLYFSKSEFFFPRIKAIKIPNLKNSKTKLQFYADVCRENATSCSLPSFKTF